MKGELVFMIKVTVILLVLLIVLNKYNRDAFGKLFLIISHRIKNMCLRIYDKINDSRK